MNRLSDRSIRFLHLADLHFGVENHGRIDPETGMHSRLLDFSATLEKILDRALEMEIDAVLFAGDAYRTGRPTPTQERELARHIERIGRAGLPLVMITGNHDLPSSSGQAHAIEVFRTLELPHLYLTDRLETLHVPTRRGTLQVICIPYPARHRFPSQAGIDPGSLSGEQEQRKIASELERFIENEAAGRNPGEPAVLLAHIGISEASLSGTERTMHLADEVKLPRSALMRPGIDYCALGHVHRFQDLNPEGSPPIVYPGTIERIDFGEEKDKKGFVIAEVEPGRARYQFFPLASRPFVTIQRDLSAEPDPTEAIRKAIEQEAIEGAVVRLECTLTDEQKITIDLKEIDAALEPANHVAGFSLRPPEAPEPVRRSQLTESVSIQNALKTYFESQNIPGKKMDELLQRARQLEEELWGRLEG